jgi:hypothetical protein
MKNLSKGSTNPLRDLYVGLRKCEARSRHVFRTAERAQVVRMNCQRMTIENIFTGIRQQKSTEQTGVPERFISFIRKRLDR